MAWSYWICETRSGERLHQVYPTDHGSWQRRLAYKGQGSTDFLLSDNPQFKGAFRGPEWTLVVCWDNEPWYAGVLWKRKYDRAAGTVSVGHEDLWSVLERRLAIPQDQAVTVPGRSVIQTRVTYESSLRTHFKLAMRLGMRGPDLNRPEYELPIWMEPDVPGNRRISYWTYDFLTVAEALGNIMDMGISSAVDFHPRWAEGTGNLEWYMRIVPRAVEDELFISVDTKKSEITDLTVSEDYSEWVSELHVTGEGSETGTLHRRRWDDSNRPAGAIALARHEAMSDIKEPGDLGDRTEGEYWSRRRLPQQIECVAQVGRELSPRRFWLGRTVTLRVHNDDPVLGKGDHQRQVIGVTSSGPNAVKLELAPL